MEFSRNEVKPICPWMGGISVTQEQLPKNFRLHNPLIKQCNKILRRHFVALRMTKST